MSADVGDHSALAADVAAYDGAAAAYQQRWKGHRLRDAARRFGALAGRGARVVDVASGPALDVRLLRDVGLVAYSGDRAGRAMHLAKTLHPKGCLAQWDFRQLPFADGVFDGVWAPAALQHVPRAAIRATLAEWRRVQRRGPVFVTMREGSGDLEPVDDPPVGTVHATSVSEDEMEALLLAGGWTRVEVERRPDLLLRPGVGWVHGFGQLEE